MKNDVIFSMTLQAVPVLYNDFLITESCKSSKSSQLRHKIVLWSHSTLVLAKNIPISKETSEMH